MTVNEIDVDYVPSTAGEKGIRHCNRECPSLTCDPDQAAKDWLGACGLEDNMLVCAASVCKPWVRRLLVQREEMWINARQIRDSSMDIIDPTFKSKWE